MKNIVNYAKLVKERHALNETIAPVEVDQTDSSRAYAVGDQLIYDGILYDVIDDIAQHGIITAEGAGANIEEADTIVEQIKNKTITTDAVPTQGSTNPVQSGGTFDAILNEAKTRGELGAKNILPFDLAEIKALNTNGTWAGNVYTYRGVAFTVNSDGTISATGTATGGNASIKLFAASSNYEMLGKEVILTGCPNNGSASTYRIQAYRMASADGSTGTYFDDGTGTDAFTVLNDASGTVGSFAIAVYENATVTNLLFKPMVRLASDPDATYQPYAKTNQELTAENQILTKYANSQSNPNLLDNPWFTINQRGQSSYNASGYIVDRWSIYSNDNTKNVTVDSGVTFDSGFSGLFYQRLDSEMTENIMGKDAVLSVLLSDGSIISSNITFPSVAPSGTLELGNKQIREQWYVRLRFNGTIWLFELHTYGLPSTSSLSVKAVKLELGPVSTLAIDTAPNYATELLKCQRYFVRLAPNSSDQYGVIGLGVMFDATRAWVPLNLPVAMRVKPSISFNLDSGKIKIAGKGSTAGAGKVVTAISVSDRQPMQLIYFDCASQSDLSAGDAVTIWFVGTTDAYIDLSADL